ncbi:MAG: GHKL domain-containing protein [Deltaproteobacteria bacterium]|nr:GHKL domain-containing protein [Deltaproteobacteria bacterium]MBI4797074.1 GHKL domain-containing protein [Deltaproteobacteria bacterium]
MEPDRVRRFFSPAPVILAILAGAVLLSALFFFFWQKLNHRVEIILQEQFNQQQLMLARKIADNVESYFDFIENSLLGYAGLYQTISPQAPQIEVSLAERFSRHKLFGILEIRRYNAEGAAAQVFSTSPSPAPTGSLVLPAPYLEWARNPAHRGKLFLSKTFVYADSPWKNRRVMRFLTPLYWADDKGNFSGVVELLIDPFFICEKVTADVRSGQTGYAWIIDQDVIFLTHYEKDFVGQEAMAVRMARNPNIIFRGLREINAKVLAGQEGVGEYDSGWHRQRLGLTPKLVAYTPIRFAKGLIREVTEVEDPARNIWGVAVVAPVAEVSGSVGEVMHQELFLVGTFFVLVLLATAVLIGAALTWNKTLTRKIDLKTQELLESQERLVHSERFAAVGEAAAYVSHEIKNPLMVIGGMAHQVERRLDDQETREKLKIIQNEVKRLESFLGDLRDFTRPVLPVKQKIDLNQVIREVEDMMVEAAREKGVTLGEKLDPVPFLEADPNQLKQVLVNLIKNALEATEVNGQILLAAGFRDGQAWFSVKDTGKGMPSEVLENIFHPFFTTKDKGTGLGLAVIHKIITDHHGTVQVVSAPGRGSTFLVKLPLS